MKMDDQTVKPAPSLVHDSKYVNNRNVTQPCVYDEDDSHSWKQSGRKTADDLRKWLSRKQENRSS